MNQIIATAQTCKTAQIKEMARALMNDLSEEASMVLNALLSILEARLPEAEFIAICEELDDSI